MEEIKVEIKDKKMKEIMDGNVKILKEQILKDINWEPLKNPFTRKKILKDLRTQLMDLIYQASKLIIKEQFENNYKFILDRFVPDGNYKEAYESGFKEGDYEHISGFYVFTYMVKKIDVDNFLRENCKYLH